MSVAIYVSPRCRRTPLVELGARLATTTESSLLVLHSRSVSDAITEECADVPTEVELIAVDDVCDGIVSELAKHDVSTLLVEEQELGAKRRSVARELTECAPCCVVLLRLGDCTALPLNRILVPTCGGPNAKWALRLAAGWLEPGGEITALRVVGDYQEASDVGAARLERDIASARLEEAVDVNATITVSDDPLSVISEEALGGSHDLILLGASRNGPLRRLLFGTIPGRLFARQQSEGKAAGIVRQPWPFVRRWRALFERWLDVTIPQLERADRIELFERVESGSMWSFDFGLLLVLSTAIASLGLLQSSTAVVIGAMLVAPLMTPLLGAGLALVQGNQPLMRQAAFAIVLGFVVSLVIGGVAGTVVPISGLTSELAARGGPPSLLDLIVAFLSGVAAAHCQGRPNLSSALPGVAIAAALVPPIATSGISLAIGEGENAAGAAMLFGTSVLAIVFGAAASFFAAGIRPRRGRSGQAWARHGIALLTLAMALLAVPLGSVLLSNLGSERGLDRELESRLGSIIEAADGELAQASILRVERERVVCLRVRVADRLPETTARELSTTIKNHFGNAMRMRIRTELEQEW